MPLVGDNLGLIMYTAATAFNDVPAPTTPEQLEEMRLNFFKAQANAIINYLKTNGLVTTACGAGAGTGTIT